VSRSHEIYRLGECPELARASQAIDQLEFGFSNEFIRSFGCLRSGSEIRDELPCATAFRPRYRRASWMSVARAAWASGMRVLDLGCGSAGFAAFAPSATVPAVVGYATRPPGPMSTTRVPHSWHEGKMREAPVRGWHILTPGGHGPRRQVSDLPGIIGISRIGARAHNPKVACSKHAPPTIKPRTSEREFAGFFRPSCRMRDECGNEGAIFGVVARRWRAKSGRSGCPSSFSRLGLAEDVGVGPSVDTVKRGAGIAPVPTAKWRPTLRTSDAVEAPGVEPSPAFCLTINGHADLRDKTRG
jgi:hypothetical protein